VAIKFPLLNETKLNQLYQASPAEQWGINQNTSNRHFLKLEELAKPNNQAESKSVLDYGCSNGDLLASWDSSWAKFGIELSKQARDIAKTRGITVTNESHLTSRPNFFNAIVMVDVIEHLIDPCKTFTQLIDALQPGGKLIIVTGDTDSMGFTMAKGSYWYCDIPEHIVFFNQKSLDVMFNKLGLRRLNIYKIPHTKVPFRYLKMLQPLLKFGLFHIYKVVNRILPILKLNRTTYPNTHIFKDHLIAVYEKPNATQLDNSTSYLK
jgi:SAM-dependent methyltransferase